ncbi:MAG TPA: hypothetical protein PLO59_07760, partial [Bacteroidia bacterium]|nr:hypothetical protein [Bacteroidia bacterium]
MANMQKHQLIIFNGKHEWCPATVLTDAVAAMLIWNNDDSVLKSNYTKNQLKLIAKLKQKKQYLDASISYNALISVDNKPGFNNELSDLKNSAYYKNQLYASKSVLINEQNNKQHYAVMMQQGIDTGYWINEVKMLQKLIQNEMLMASNQRLLSFLSLMAYTLSNKALAQNNITAAQYFTNCYNIVDTSNAETNFLKAIVAARLGNNNQAIQQLNVAKQKGFTNWNRINAEPAFTNLNWRE